MKAIVITEGPLERDAVAIVGWHAAIWEGDPMVARGHDTAVIVPTKPGLDTFVQSVSEALDGAVAAIRVVDLGRWVTMLDPDNDQRRGILERALALADWEAGQLAIPGVDSIELGAQSVAPVGETGHLSRQSLAAHHFRMARSDIVRYDHGGRTWYTWESHRWRPDRDGQVRRMWLEVLADRVSQAIKDQDEPTIKAVIAAGATESAIEGGLSIASTMEPIATDGTLWDPDPWILGCDNGLVDLHNGTLRRGDPEDFVTRSTRLSFAPEAGAPRWERFLQEVFDGDNELIEWFQLLVGATFVGQAKEVLPICHGTGSNGKSVAYATLSLVGGDYAVDISIETVINARRDAGRATPDLIRLRGARLAIATEPDKASRLNGGTVKRLASIDPISGRALYGAQQEWLPTHTLHVLTNHLPQVDDESEGFWRRIALIPWPIRFRKPGDSGIGPEQDPGLKQALAKEAPGILGWVVRGAARYAEAGTVFPLPEAVQVQTQAYRDEEDTTGVFFRTKLGPSTSNVPIRGGLLFTVYQAWAEGLGLSKAERLSSRQFGREMATRYERLPFPVTKTVSRGVTAYRGVQVVDATDAADGDPPGIDEDLGGRIEEGRGGYGGLVGGTTTTPTLAGIGGEEWTEAEESHHIHHSSLATTPAEPDVPLGVRLDAPKDDPGYVVEQAVRIFGDMACGGIDNRGASRPHEE